MRTSIGLVGLALAIALTSGAVHAQKPVAVQVFKDASSGCCANWVEHLRRKGFAPTSENVADINAVKAKYGVPAQTRSCHTALVGGYVIEGHVPAADIQRLLKQRPAVVGIAAGGMPVGSPGMEVPGRPAEPYDVVSFDKNGRTAVFSSHR